MHGIEQSIKSLEVYVCPSEVPIALDSDCRFCPIFLKFEM